MIRLRQIVCRNLKLSAKIESACRAKTAAGAPGLRQWRRCSVLAGSEPVRIRARTDLFSNNCCCQEAARKVKAARPIVIANRKFKRNLNIILESLLSRAKTFSVKELPTCFAPAADLEAPMPSPNRWQNRTPS